ncbi:MAG TPA: response regulator transcription factor [Myxococcota bacterium]|nr:response regulator transcription factor [Myxococcota bacterium]
MKILLLEDDRETAAALEKGLAREGHFVAVANDLDTGMRLADEESFEAAVLDVVLPGGGSGFEVLERLRTAQQPPYVLMLTARGSIEDRVEGLDRGADDYLVKPFSFLELAARLRALERRHYAPTTRLVRGGLELDLVARIATAGTQRLPLTPTEFSLVVALLQAQGAPVTRRQLLREVWGYDFDPGTNVVDVCVNRVRRKLEDAGISEGVRTIRGQGYAAG